MTTDPRDRCSPRVRAAYALPGFALALVGIPVFVYLPKFYTDTIGVSMTALGAILLLARVLDAFVDPLVGAISDRTVSPLGRRRPYLAYGVVPLVVAAFMLYVPPAMGGMWSTVWFTMGVVLFFFLWTLVTIPYRSLGPELTLDFDERTALFGVRDAAIIFGTMAAAALPPVIGKVLDLPATAEGERTRFLIYAMFAAPVLVVACVGCAAVVRERPASRPDAQPGLLTGTRMALQNRPFAILLASYTVSAFGSNLPASLIPYYVQYVLKADIVAPIFLLYFTVGIAAIPLWVRVARRFGKKAAFLCATGINTGAFSLVFFLPEGQVTAYAILVGLAGIGGGAVIVMPNSMQADVIDYDELRTGARREGQFVGLWSVAEKLAAALGVGIALPLLDMAGYMPNVAQTPQVLFTLRVLYVLVPVGCNLLAMFLVLGYPIDRRAHDAIREGIVARRAGLPVRDPLEDRLLAPEPSLQA